MTLLTAQEARTLATLNAHHHGDAVLVSLHDVLEQVRAAALEGHRETVISQVKVAGDLSELMQALQALGFLARSHLGSDNVCVLNLSW